MIVVVGLIHSVIAVLVILAVAPLAVVDVFHRRFRLRWRPFGIVALAGTAYVFASRGDVQLPAGRLDAGAYIARLRAFQYHYFFEFSTSFLRPFAEDIASWLIAVTLIVAACLALRRVNDNLLAHRAAVIVAAISALSMLGWAHSNLARPDVTLLVITLHRSSTFVNLLLLVLVLPLLFEQAAGRRLRVTAAVATVWCLLPGAIDHARFGAIVLALAVSWVVAELRQQPDRLSLGAAAVVVPVAAFAVYFLTVSEGIAGSGWAKFASAAGKDTGLVIALVVVLALALLCGLRDTEDRRLAQGATIAVTVTCVLGLLVGRTFTENPRAFTGLAKQQRADLIDVAMWARAHTAKDAVFLLPLTDDGFGWRTFADRASAGKPREWLHYAFLYSRDQRVMAEGTRRADLLGLDVDQWFAEHPQLGSGGQLVAELSALFTKMSGEQAAHLADQLHAGYVVVEVPTTRAEPCFRAVYANATYDVFEVQKGCAPS